MNFWLRCEAYFSERPHYGPYWLWIQNGRIIDIQRSEPVGASDPILNTGTTYLLPLLSDTHVHCYLNPWPLDPRKRTRPGTCSLEDEVQSGMQRLQKALARGTGFVRDMGDPLGINLEIKKRISDNPREFPAIQVSGPAIHRTGKYGRLLGVACDSLQDILGRVDDLALKQEVDFIKVISTGIVDFAKKTVNQEAQFSTEELREVVKRAAQHGLPVASHASGPEGIDINLEAGVSFIEHGYLIREDQVNRLREKGISWTPTFSPVHQQAVNPESGWESKTRQSLHQILHDHEKAIRSAHKQGVRILCGTDAGSPGCDMGNGLHTEIKCLAHCMELTEVLRLVTSGNADACSHPDYTGRIRMGDPASFSLYSAAPWENLSCLGSPRQVYQHGVSISSRETPSHASN